MTICRPVFYLQPSRHRRSNTYLRRQSHSRSRSHPRNKFSRLHLSLSLSPCKVYPQIISGNTNQSQSSEQTSGGGGGGGVHAHFQSSKFLSFAFFLFLLGSSRFNWLNPVTKATQRLATAIAVSNQRYRCSLSLSLTLLFGQRSLFLLSILFYSVL